MGWVERYRKMSSGRFDFLNETRMITLARVLLAQDLPNEALQVLDGLAGAAEAGDRTGRLIEILVLQAICLSMLHVGEKKQNASRSEFDVLERSLRLAKSESFLRLYIDEGPLMDALLQQAAARGIEPIYIHQLLGAFPVRLNSQPAGAQAIGVRRAPSCLVEPLTERELEVLHWMAKGLSNREIAERLVLANGTVKAHAHNICGKLGVRNRMQAILRAQQLGLLP
jgi:LuxR family maltose regulon positive regulatory protein